MSRVWTPAAGGSGMPIAGLRLRSALVLAGMLGLLGGAGVTRQLPVEGRAQFQQPVFGQPPGASPVGRPSQTPSVQDDPNDMRRRVEEKQSQARNDDRQRRLVADSDKLLALATELHDAVAKTDKNILSVEVVKKATEMEKLSRDLKERMKG